MSEESVNILDSAMAELISKTLDGVDAVGEFASAEIPELIEQALMWYMAYSAIWFSIGLIYIVICYKAIKWSLTGSRLAWQKDQINDGIPMPLLYLFATLLVIFPAEVMDLNWLKIWIAPKLWLIEYAASLVK